jgi:hypothetical protein
LHQYKTPDKLECSGFQVKLDCENAGTVWKEPEEAAPSAEDAAALAAELAAEKAQKDSEIVARAEALEKAAAIANEELATAQKLVKNAKIALLDAKDSGSTTSDELVVIEIAELDLAAAEAGLDAAEAAAEASGLEASSATIAAADLRASGVVAVGTKSATGGPPFKFGKTGDENCPADYVWILDPQTCEDAAKQFGFNFTVTDPLPRGSDADEEASAADTDLFDTCCRTLLTGEAATISSSKQVGGAESKVICQMDPRKVTIIKATYGDNCKNLTQYKYDAEEGFEGTVSDYFKEQCYNRTSRAWKKKCEFQFESSEVADDPAPGCPKQCTVSWICGFNETRTYDFPKTNGDEVGDCAGSTVKINCDVRPEDLAKREREKAFLYMLGNKGQELCPKGFARIMDEEECEAAAAFFKLKYDQEAMNHDGREAFVCRTWGAGDSKHTRMSSKHGRNSQWVCNYDIFGELIGDTTSGTASTAPGGFDVSKIEVWAEGVKVTTNAMKAERARKRATGEKNKVLALANTADDGGDCSYRCAGLQHQPEKQADTCKVLGTHMGKTAEAEASSSCEVGYESGYFVACYQVCKNASESVNRRILKKYLNNVDSVCAKQKNRLRAIGCGSGFVAGVDASAIEQQHRARAWQWNELNKKVGNKVIEAVKNATGEEPREEWEPTEEEPLSPEDQEAEDRCVALENNCRKQHDLCNRTQTECKEGMKKQCKNKGKACQKMQSQCMHQKVRCQTQEDDCDIEKEMCEQDREVRAEMTKAVKEVEWMDVQGDAEYRRLQWLTDEGQVERLMRLFVIWDQIQWVMVEDAESRAKKMDRLDRVRHLRELKAEKEKAKTEAKAKKDAEEPLVVAVDEGSDGVGDEL